MLRIYRRENTDGKNMKLQSQKLSLKIGLPSSVTEAAKPLHESAEVKICF